jgi:hypothetical protein
MGAIFAIGTYHLLAYSTVATVAIFNASTMQVNAVE